MNRKGQGISINVIVIAAIALIILVILSTLVIRTGGTINKGTNVCGGSTASEMCKTSCDPVSEIQVNKPCLKLGSNEVDTSQICCITA